MALELFLIDGRTFLIAFASKEDRDKIYENLNSRNLVNRISYESDVVLQNTLLRVSITQKVMRKNALLPSTPGKFFNRKILVATWSHFVV